MTTYLVSVYTYAPYKIEGVYRQVGSTESAAISRAIKQYRQEKIPRRKIKELYIKAEKLL